MELLTLFKEQLLQNRSTSSKSTLKNYLSDVRHFISWCENLTKKQFDAESVTPELIKLYQESLGGIIENASINPSTQLSTASMKRHISSLRKFFSILKKMGAVTRDPFAYIEPEVTDIPTDLWHLKSFKDHLQLQKASKITIKNYLSDISGFAKWYEETILPGLEKPLSSTGGFYLLTQQILEDYRTRLLEIQNAAPRTVNRKLSALRRYLSFVTQKGFINSSELTLDPVKAYEETVLTPQPSIVLSELPKAEKKEKVYSKLPPVRLIQKLFLFPYLTLEEKVASSIASFIAGRPVSGIEKLPPKLSNLIESKNKVRSASNTVGGLLGIRNVAKEFYAPEKVSLLGTPLYKRAIYHFQYTRPNWYKRYHNYSFVHYVHFALLVIFASGVGVALYQNLIVKKQTPIFAAPTNPPRLISFQGRLTDNLDNPITSSTNLRFAIYNDSSASGAALLWQEAITNIAPDQDGIFSVYLGNGTQIPSTVFTDNANIYLGVSVYSTPELTPRQRIASVGYATSSEFLQGMPPTNQSPTAITSFKNVILALDSNGNFNLNDSVSTDHTFQVGNGAFYLKGQTLNLTTNLGSDGNIIISPDGLGKTDIQKPLINTSSMGNLTPGGVEVNDKFGVLATESAVAAFTVNNNTSGGDIFAASSSGTTRFAIQNDGTLVTKYTTAGGIIFGTNSSGVLGQTTSGSSGQCLQSAAGGTPTWGTCGSGSDWRINLGTISPNNDTLDLLVGANTTASAKFRFLNVLTGTPVASVSANNGNNATFLTGDGTLGTTNRQTLTIGNSSTYNTTGNILFNPNGIGRIGIGTTTPLVGFDLRGISGTTAAASVSANTSFATLIVDNSGNGDLITASASGVSNFVVKNNGDVVVGQDGSGKITAGIVDPYLVQNQKTSGTQSLTFQTLGATNADFIFKNASTTLSTLTMAGQFQLPVTGSTGGIVLGGDTQIFRGAADRIDFASGDSLNLVSGSLLIGGSTVIDSSKNATFQTLNVTGGCTGCTNGVPSPFQSLNGAIVPLNGTLDFLIGDQATTSAKFAVLNINGSNTPTASVSAVQNNTAAYISGDGSLQSVRKQTLTLGGSTTGDIAFKPGASVNPTLYVQTGGNIGIGTTTPGAALDVVGSLLLGANSTIDARSSGTLTIGNGANTTGLTLGKAGATTTFNSTSWTATPTISGLVTGTSGFSVASGQSYTGAGAVTLSSGSNTDLTVTAQGSGNLILTSDFDTSVKVGNSSNTPASLSVSGGIGSNGLLILNQNNSGDILAASTSGSTKFVIKNDGTASSSAGFTIDAAGALQTTKFQTLTLGGSSTGNIVISPKAGSGTIQLTNFSTNGGVLYTNGSGVLSQTGAGSGSQCLLGNLTWGSCSTGTTASPFQEFPSLGVITENNTTEDFLIGATATTSAKFAVLNIAGGTPTASVSSGLNGNGAWLDANGNFQTANKRTLTLGGGSTGNITIQGNNILTIVDQNISLSGINPTFSAAGTNTLTLNNNATGNIQFFSSSNTLTSTGVLTIAGNATINGGTVQLANGSQGTIQTASNADIVLNAGSGTINLNTSVNGPVLTGTGLLTAGGGLRVNGATTTFANAAPTITTGNNTDLTITPNGTGNLILTTDFNTGVKIGDSTNTSAPLSVSGGIGLNAAAIINQLNGGDIFTASAAGSTKFTISNTGNITDTAATSVNFSNATLTVASCSGCGGVTSVNSPFEILSNSGAITEKISNLDFLLGGTSTPSAKFAVLNINSGTPTASVSSGLNGTASYIDANGNFATTKKQTFTLGSSETGNIAIGTDATARTISIGNTAGASVLNLDSGTGNINIGNTIAKTISIGNSTGATALNLTAGTGSIALASTSTGDITLNSSDTLLLDSAGVLELNSSAGVISIGNDAVNQNINIGTAGTRTIAIGNTTSSTTLNLDSGTGGINIGDNTITKTIDLGGNDSSAQDTIRIATNGTAADTISIGNSNASTTVAITGGTAWGITTGGALTVASCSGCGGVTSANSPFEILTGNGAITQKNTTIDLLLGSISTASAKFAVLNINNGTPTASVSSGLNGTGAYFDANGNFNTVKNMTLSIGSATTGNVLINPTAGGKFVGIGTSSPQALLDIQGTTTAVASVSATTNGNGTGIVLGGDGSIQSVRKNTLTLGGGTSGNILIQGNGILSIADATINLTGTNPTLGATGSNTLTINGNSTGNIQFFSSSNTLTNGGALTIAGNATINGTTLQIGNGSNSTIQTATNGNLTLTAAGSGNLTLSSDFNSSVFVGGASTPAPLSVSGGIGLNAAFVLNQTNSGDLFAASASGTTKFVIKNDGTASSSAGFTIDGVGNIQSTRNQSLTLGGGSTGELTLGRTSQKVFLPGFDCSAQTNGGKLTTTSGGVLTCSADTSGASGFSSPFRESTSPTGSIFALNSTEDVLLGGQASTSAALRIIGQENPFKGTLPAATISANTSFAGLVVDNKGVGDLFTASSSGVTQFQIKNGGAVGIGTIAANNPTAMLDVAGTASISSALTFRTGAGSIQTTANNTLTLGGATTGNIIINPLGGAQLGIGTISPLATIDIRGALQALGGTQAVASVSGKTSYAALTVDNLSTLGDLFTASSSSNTQFVIKNGGAVGIGNAARIPTAQLDVAGTASISSSLSFRTGNGTIQTTALNSLTIGGGTTGFITLDSGSGQISLLDNTNLTGNLTGLTGLTLSSGGITLGGTVGTGTQCIKGGASASWGACSSGAASPFQELSGAIVPLNSTEDLLIGGQASTSAKFAVLNVNGSGPATASVSGNLIVMPTNGGGGFVGIGTTAPSQKLAVAGNAQFIGNQFASEDFEGAFPPATWTTGGDVNWAQTTAQRQSGSNSAASGTITDSQNSWLRVSKTFTNDGFVKFYWRVESEKNFDYLAVCIDNTGCTGHNGYYARISGSVDWNQVSIPVKSGTHTIQWVYSKDAGSSTGADKGWIDNVTFQTDGNLFIDGNVAIGTSSAIARLDVQGSINASTGYMLGGQTILATSYDKTNIFAGFDSGIANTQGFYNSSLGYRSLNSNTTGYGNSAIGMSSLFNNSTGIYNTVSGYIALFANTTGSYNAATGYQALNTSNGSFNTAMGTRTLLTNTSGTLNTAVGYQAGSRNSVGGTNSLFGANSDVESGNLINATAIGANSFVGANDALVLGSIYGVNSATGSAKIGIGTIAPKFTLDVNGGYGTNSLVTFNQTGAGDIFNASSSGITQFQITNNGNVEIGTVNAPANTLLPDPKFQVYSTLGTSPAASISAKTAAPSLLVSNDGSGDIFVASVAGQPMFAIHGNGNIGTNGQINTEYGDIAEYMKKADPAEQFQAGQLVCLSQQEGATKCSNNSNQRLIGVVSDNAMLIGYSRYANNPGYVLVGMVGQLGVWVTGNIKAGDPLTYSSTPGYATKATTQGNIIGYAKVDNNGDQMRVDSVIQPDYYNPNDRLQDQNVFASLTMGLSNGIYTIFDAFGNSINHIDAFSKAMIANLEVGFAHVRTLAADSISVGGQNLSDYITQTVNNILSTTYSLQPTTLVSPTGEVKTNVISPLADNSAPSIGFRDNKAVILSQGEGSQTVSWFDNNGNASFSGQLTSRGIETENITASSSSFQTSNSQLLSANTATVAGTLTAGTIIAGNIEGLDQKLATLAASITGQKTLDNSQNATSSSQTSPSCLLSSGSCLLSANTIQADFGIFEQGITSMGPVTSNILTATDQLSVGSSFTITNNAINTVGTDLAIQSLRQGAISFEGGLIKMDTDGNMSIAGNLNLLGEIDAVTGVFSGTLTTPALYTGLISPLPGDDLTIKLSDSASTSGKLRVVNNSNQEVLSINSRGDIDASGTATFAKLNFNLVGKAEATSLTEAVATGSAGFATLRSGQPEITVKNKNVTSKSLIYITPFGDTGGKVLYLLRQVPQSDTDDGSFTVGLSGGTSAQDLQFNWLIVN